MSTRDKAWNEDRKVCEKATPGPWVVSNERYGIVIAPECHKYVFAQTGICDCDGGTNNPDSRKDAAFISRARTRWPIALREVVRLTAEVGQLKAEIKRLKCTGKPAKRTAKGKRR